MPILIILGSAAAVRRSIRPGGFCFPKHVAWVLSLLTFLYAFDHASRYIIVPAKQTMMDRGLIPREIDYQMLAGTAYTIPFCMGLLPFGWLADRGNKVKILSICCMSWGVLVVSMGLVQNFVGLAMCRAASGFLQASSVTLSASIASDYFPGSKRAKAIGILNLGVWLGISIAFGVGGGIIVNDSWGEYGYRYVMGLIGGSAMVLSSVLGVTVRDVPSPDFFEYDVSELEEQEEDTVEEESDGQALISVTDMFPGSPDREPICMDDSSYGSTSAKEKTSSRKPSLAPTEEEQHLTRLREEKINVLERQSHPVSMAHTLGFFSGNTMLLLLTVGGIFRLSAGTIWLYNSFSYYQHTFGMTEGEIARFMGWVPAMAGSAGSFFGGFVSDKLLSKHGVASRIKVMIVGSLVSVPCCAVMLLLNNPAPWSFFFMFGFYLFGECYQPLLITAIVESVPKNIRVTGVALAMLVMTAIGGQAPLLLPSFQSLFPDTKDDMRWALLILMPVLIVLAVACWVASLYFLTKEEERLMEDLLRDDSNGVVKVRVACSMKNAELHASWLKQTQTDTETKTEEHSEDGDDDTDVRLHSVQIHQQSHSSQQQQPPSSRHRQLSNAEREIVGRARMLSV